MTGILKLFDYQEMLTTGRVTGHTSKRNPIGGSQFNKHVQDKRMIYAEYSGFPSSSPPRRQDTLLFDPLIMPENYSNGPRTRQVSTTSSYREPYYLQEVVKDSMYQEARKQPSKTNAKKTDGTYGIALYGRTEPKEHSRSTKEVSFFSLTKEDPRFSYNEKDSSSSSSSFKSRDGSKYQDMARLSRDGQESSTRSLKFETQPIRSPSVVAKLMGLDALPNNVEPYKPVQVSVQSKKGSMIKPVSRLPIVEEPAPWKQVDRSATSSVKATTRNNFPTVYSEIEKRLKDLEFSQSGKDLRALKQILGAMQEKEQGLKNPRFIADQKAAPKPSRNELIYSFTKQGGHYSYESPIVIMKPAKSTQKSGKTGNTGSVKSNGSSIGSRVSSHKKQSEPRVPLTDSARSRTRSHKQENGTPSLSSSTTCTSRRHRSKYTSLQRNDEELSEISSESTNTSYHENDNSAQFEATSAERSIDIINCQNPFTKTFKNSVSCLPKKECIVVTEQHPEIAPEYPSPVSVLDSILDLDDAPSPVKHEGKTNRGYETRDSDILSSSDHAMRYGGNNPFEFNRRKLKNIENLVLKLQSVNSSHDEARTDYIASLCENTNPDHRYISEILLASGILLNDIGSSLTNFQFHPSGYPINPGLFLVLEQTKASSFLEYPPTEKTTTHLKSKQKIHRRLIFDTINELLARKLVSLQLPFSPTPRKLALTTLNAQKLLRELCFEIDELQSRKTKQSSENEDDSGLKDLLREDVMNPLEGWLDDNSNKVSSIVLDIERMVFKDLVDEVLVGETPGLKNSSSRRRQLFPK